MYKVGDKFTVEIAEVLESKSGKKYRIEPFASLFFDDYGLQVLEGMKKPKDYKERLRAEYLELCEKLEALHKTIIKLDVDNDLPFENTEYAWLLEEQEEAMTEYKNILEKRMYVEGIL